MDHNHVLVSYLGHFTKPITKSEFRKATQPDGFQWSNSVIWRLKKKGWIVHTEGKWMLTWNGHMIWRKYLGVSSTV